MLKDKSHIELGILWSKLDSVIFLGLTQPSNAQNSVSDLCTPMTSGNNVGTGRKIIIYQPKVWVKMTGKYETKDSETVYR